MILPLIYSNHFINFFKSLVKLSILPYKWKTQFPRLNLNFQLAKITLIPRYKPIGVNIFGSRFKLVDSGSFLWTYEELFDSQIYKFNSEVPNPVIIDCGANIGMSILFFKQQYPDSRIIAFEPDVNIFKTLEENIKSFNLSGVELIRKATWKSEGFLEFISEGADAGKLSQEVTPNTTKYKVPTVRLSNYLKQPIDLLKIDIEGAETEVLEDCQQELVNVKNIFVEYHSFANKPQSLNILINILSQAGFRIYIQTLRKSPQPLFKLDVFNDMDMQLNIFGWRES